MIRPNPLRVQAPNDYPTGDGKPMAETDVHRDLMLALIETLKWWFRDRPDVYVSGNLLVHYQPGNKRRHVSPDVFVVHGVGNHTRINYLHWEEGDIPFVIELTSKSTSREDRETKRRLYLERLGVKEYVLFDPMQEYLDPSFQMFRRHGGDFRRVTATDGRFRSRILGLEMERDGTQLRLRDPATGNRLPTPGERATAEHDRANAADARADAADARAEAEAARADRLQQELDRLRQALNGHR